MAQSKEKLLETFLELCEEKEYTKISVTDIVDRCNTTRQTFYYHFKNIDELVTWAFESQISQICDSISPNDTWQSKSPELFVVIKKYQMMIKNAISTKKCLEMIDNILRFIKTFIETFITIKDPTRKHSNDFLIETLQYTVTGQIINELHKPDPNFDELCKYICNNVASGTKQ